MFIILPHIYTKIEKDKQSKIKNQLSKVGFLFYLIFFGFFSNKS